MTDLPRPRSRVLGRAWADLPLRAKGLVVVAIPLLGLLLATVLFGVALGQDRQAQGAVLHSVEVERQIAQVRVLVQAGVTGYVLTGSAATSPPTRRSSSSCPGPSLTWGTWSATTRARSTAWARSRPSPTGGPGSCGRWSPTSGPAGRRPAGSG